MSLTRLILFSTLWSVLFLATGCSKKTTDTKEAFVYWAGQDPPQDMELIQADYYESPHFTKEYEMYLKFKPSKEWWKSYVKLNHLLADSIGWAKPVDAPAWFKPTSRSLRLMQPEFDQGSRYFCDTATWICYIYEIQL